MDAGINEARVYADQHPVNEAVWPDELRDPDRQRIDTTILRGVGLNRHDADAARTRLYSEIVAFTRKARLLELEAQVNRRGGGGGEAAGAAELADDLWADLTARNVAEARLLPTDFIPDGMQSQTVNLPAAGRPQVDEGNLFNAGQPHALQFGRDNVVAFDSTRQRDLCLFLAAQKVRGEIEVPRRLGDCQTVVEAIRAYVDDLTPKLREGAAERTENPELQARIVNEAMKRLLPHRR